MSLGCGGKSTPGETGNPGGTGGMSGTGGGGSDPCSSVGPAASPDMVTFAPRAMVSTLAGSADYGTTDGAGASATFKNPVGVIVEPAGSLLVADYDSNTVRRVATDGTVTTLTKQPGFAQPFGFGYGKYGDLFVSTDYNPAGMKDPNSGTIWRLDPGSGVATAMAADIGRARSFAAIPDGRLVVTNYENNRLYLVDSTTGKATELAGSGGTGCGTFVEGTAGGAAFNIPYGVVVLSDGRIVVADRSNHRLRAVTLQGAVTTYAGDGGVGTIDGPAAQARFAGPEGLALDSHDNIYVTDPGAKRIRRVGADGTVTTLAGNGTAGFMDGAGADAQFWGQEGIAVTPDGMTVYVADGTGGEGSMNNRIRKITLAP